MLCHLKDTKFITCLNENCLLLPITYLLIILYLLPREPSAILKAHSNKHKFACKKLLLNNLINKLRVIVAMCLEDRIRLSWQKVRYYLDRYNVVYIIHYKFCSSYDFNGSFIAVICCANNYTRFVYF